MLAGLTIDRIFGIGIEIEKNGVAFYSAAASLAVAAPVKSRLEMFVKWETVHADTFARLRSTLPKELKNNDMFDPATDASKYVKFIADSMVFPKNRNMAELAGGCSSIPDLVNIALSLEKESVVFYATVREIIPESAGKAHIDSILHEELTHIWLLTDELQKHSGA